MDRLEVRPWHQALGEGVADAAAERVDQVFFGMAVRRAVDPLAAAALAAVRLEKAKLEGFLLGSYLLLVDFRLVPRSETIGSFPEAVGTDSPEVGPVNRDTPENDLPVLCTSTRVTEGSSFLLKRAL